MKAFGERDVADALLWFSPGEKQAASRLKQAAGHRRSESIPPVTATAEL